MTTKAPWSISNSNRIASILLQREGAYKNKSLDPNESRAFGFLQEDQKGLNRAWPFLECFTSGVVSFGRFFWDIQI
jgi:hypothetical protein